MIERSSGLQTTSQIILTGPGIYTGFRLLTDKTNDAELILYDALSAVGGAEIDDLGVIGAQWSGGVEKSKGPGGKIFQVHIGIYAAVSGTGAKYLVYWAAIP